MRWPRTPGSAPLPATRRPSGPTTTASLHPWPRLPRALAGTAAPFGTPAPFGGPVPPPPAAVPARSGLPAWAIALITVGGMLVVGIVAAVALPAFLSGRQHSRLADTSVAMPPALIGLARSTDPAIQSQVAQLATDVPSGFTHRRSAAYVGDSSTLLVVAAKPSARPDPRRAGVPHPVVLGAGGGLRSGRVEPRRTVHTGGRGRDGHAHLCRRADRRRYGDGVHRCAGDGTGGVRPRLDQRQRVGPDGAGSGPAGRGARRLRSPRGRAQDRRVVTRCPVGHPTGERSHDRPDPGHPARRRRASAAAHPRSRLLRRQPGPQRWVARLRRLPRERRTLTVRYAGRPALRRTGRPALRRTCRLGLRRTGAVRLAGGVRLAGPVRHPAAVGRGPGTRAVDVAGAREPRHWWPPPV